MLSPTTVLEDKEPIHLETSGTTFRRSEFIHTAVHQDTGVSCCFVDLTHAAVIREEGISVEKKCLHRIGRGKTVVIFLINDWLGSAQPSEGGTIPKQVNLKSLKKKDKQARESKPGSCFPTRFLHLFLLEFLP